MSIIETHAVSKLFDRVVALDRVSCTIEEGEIIGLLGSNGSGKTTLIRLLCAYFPPTSGTVHVAGFDTREAPLDVRRHVGYALEGVVLYPDLTVSDFLTFVKTVKRATPQQYDETIEQCGLVGWLQRRISTLSKGYRQRVMLAQALLGEPPILLLDEPTASMDPDMAVRVRDLIKQRVSRQTIVLSTHSLAEARNLCRRVVVLHHGQILAHGAPQEVFPRLGEVVTFEDEFVRLLATPGLQEDTKAVTHR
jgi:ABC-2 type transport system ATP-binding protein